METSKPGYGTTRLLYAGDELIAEYDGSNNLLRRYAPARVRAQNFGFVGGRRRGADIDDPVTWYEGAGTTDRRWLIADERGSVIAVTDAAGAALAVNTYDAYGKPGANNLGRFQYTGQTFVAEVGLYHYKARFYSADLGRFMQTDPIGYEDQMNLYAYAGNDPINKYDPTGLDHEEVLEEQLQELNEEIEELEKLEADLEELYREADTPEDKQNVLQSLMITKNDLQEKGLARSYQKTKIDTHDETHEDQEAFEERVRTGKVAACGAAGSVVCRPARHPVQSGICAGIAALACDDVLTENEEDNENESERD